MSEEFSESTQMMSQQIISKEIKIIKMNKNSRAEKL